MLTAANVAQQLGIGARTVYALHAAGALPGYRFGRAVRFAPADVEAYKLSLETPAKPLLSARVLREYERLRLRVPEALRTAPLSSEQQAIVDRRQRHMRKPPWADSEAMAALYAQAKRLTTETGIPHHVDHVIPLQGEYVSGLHVETNLQILTGAGNLRKKNRFEAT